MPNYIPRNGFIAILLNKDSVNYQLLLGVGKDFYSIYQ
mgnify:FL=1